MPRATAIVFLVLDALIIGQLIITGRASPSRYGFTREDDPFIYWAVFVAAVIILLLLLYAAILDGSSKYL
jgi:hypothetical protein